MVTICAQIDGFVVHRVMTCACEQMNANRLTGWTENE